MQGALKEPASRFGPAVSSSSPPRIPKARAVHVQQSKSSASTEHEVRYPSTTLPFFLKQPSTKLTTASSTVSSNALQLNKGPPRNVKGFENTTSSLKASTLFNPITQVRRVATSSSTGNETTTAKKANEPKKYIPEFIALDKVEAEGVAALDTTEQAPALPAYSYSSYTPKPVRKYIRVVEEAEKALENVIGPVGFDMEWKVVRRKGVPQRPVAVIQIADRRGIFIIQTSAMKVFPKKLKQLLEDPTIIKTGVNVKGDANKLFKDHGVKIQNLVELSWLSRQVDSKLQCGGRPAAKTLIALRKLAAAYLGKDLVKDEVRTGDWERRLDNEQLNYAANDAHCSVMLYHYFTELAKADKRSLRAHIYTMNVNLSGEVVSAVEESAREDERHAFEAESSTPPAQLPPPPPPTNARATKPMISTAPRPPVKPVTSRRPPEIIEISDSDTDSELRLLAADFRSTSSIKGSTKMHTPVRGAPRLSEAELQQLATEFQAVQLFDMPTAARTPVRRTPHALRLMETELLNLAADFKSVQLNEGAAVESTPLRRSPRVAAAAASAAAKASGSFGVFPYAEPASRVSKTMAYAMGMKK